MSTELTGLSLKVFNDRYALRDSEDNQIEKTPEEMWSRVARAIAQIEKTPELRAYWEKEFYQILDRFQFVPGGRILSGAGSGYELTFYNCFVIPSPTDSRGGILDSVKTMTEIMSRSGGVGVNISTLRPRGSRVKGVNGTASGAVSFGGLYSYATGLITQGGSRRGALMLMLNDDHPDIEEFITVKRAMGMVTNANLSVCISDKFMEAVKEDGDWDLIWGGKIFKTLKARSLWRLICESAWASGEPGLYFMERANKQSNTWYFEKLVSTNPCGEQPLGPWSVCNLGAINLSEFVTGEGVPDYPRLRRIVRAAVRFLDNVIEATAYPFPENREAQINIRRIGLGTMGLADFLIKLKVRYGGSEAVALAEEVYGLIRDETYRASVNLAAEKGSFPQFNREKYLQGHFISQLSEDIRQSISNYGIRNAVLLTQAPTGTTSLLAGVTSGIEPVYDFVFVRKDRIGEHEVYHSLYRQFLHDNPGAPLPNYFVNAKGLAPEEHVVMQATIQKYVDSSISKTVNAPQEHTVEDVERLYGQAYELGCKGVTYYREGSRDVSVLYSKNTSSRKTDKENQQKGVYKAPEPEPVSVAITTAAPALAAGQAAGAVMALSPRVRPATMTGKTYKVSTGYGTLYVTVNDDESGRAFEVFATIGKTGGFFAAKSEAICRLISLALRAGVPAEEIIDQLKGIRGPMPTWSERGPVLSIPDAIAQIMEEHSRGPQAKLNLKFDAAPEIKDKKEGLSMLIPEFVTATISSSERVATTSPLPKRAALANQGFAPECPECGGTLERGEGCLNCRGCGYSKCG